MTLVKHLQSAVQSWFFILFSRRKYYKIATTESEKMRIYQFRYQIYHEELAKAMPGTNHKLKIIKDELDDKPESILFYLDKNNEIIATMRMVIWKKGSFSNDQMKFYALDKMPWIKHYTISELERFMTRKEYRSKLIITKFIISILKYGIQQHQTEIYLQYCKPYLVPHFYKIGCLPYSKHLIDYANGIWIPLIGLLDKKFLQTIQSPVRHLLTKQNVIPKKHLNAFTQAPTSLIFTVKDILQEISKSYKNEIKMPAYPKDAFFFLAKQGNYILKVHQPIELIHDKMVDKTIFLLLKGSALVSHSKPEKQVFHNGLMIGEFAYFSPSGRRTAEVSLTQNSTLFVIKESSLKKLESKHP